MFADQSQISIAVSNVSSDHTEIPTISSSSSRIRTNTAEIDSTIIHPGSVKINVKGAFIVDQGSGGTSPSGKDHRVGVIGNGVIVNGADRDTQDIRLPNHTAVVSHIAVDVIVPYLLSPLETR